MPPIERIQPLRRFLPALLACAALSGSLAGCVAPTGPVDVTRFHAPEAAPQFGRGVISVEAAPGQPSDLELRDYIASVGRELTQLGYTQPLPGAANPNGQVALVTLDRQRFKPVRSHGPVTVGGGGGTGSYGSSVGLGIGIDLSAAPKEQVATRLAVTIRDRPTGKALWEGRAEFTVRGDSPLAGTSLGSAKMAQALFKGFPGKSGETIQVR